MNMEPYDVYRYYLALRLHFTTDNYDVIQQRGKVRASKQAFHKRKDLIAIRKIAETYSEKDLVNFLVANFVSGDRWGGLFDIEAKERYMSWKKRVESLAYTFEKDIRAITQDMDKMGKPFDQIFYGSSNSHSYIIKQYYRNKINIETLVILNKLFGFVAKYDELYKQDIVWVDLSRTIKKYDPFVLIEKEKYERLLQRVIRPQ